MKKSVFAALILSQSFATSAIAETTFGIGLGPLYNGLGINFGKLNSSPSATSLTFGALGCLSLGHGVDGTTGDCGIGAGYITSAPFVGRRHGLGLSVGLNHYFDSFSDQAQTSITFMPAYHFFFKGIDQRGFNLGLGPTFAFSDGNENSAFRTGATINIGYQF